MPYNKENLLHARQKVLGNCTALFNSHDPLHIVEGQGCWLIDAEGNRYLDCVNNVAHVGHSNPRVGIQRSSAHGRAAMVRADHGG